MRAIRYLWASPNTLFALGIGLLLLARFRIRGGVVEMHGPGIRWALGRMPVPALAMTLGHAIFGEDIAALELTRNHEQVHVMQYERWGPLFVPAYLGWSAWLYFRGRDGYRENPFEIEAYAIDSPKTGSLKVTVQRTEDPLAELNESTAEPNESPAEPEQSTDLTV